MKCCGRGRPFRCGTDSATELEVEPLIGRLRLMTRPWRTQPVAAFTTSGVSRFSAPRWSSTPQRPQLCGSGGRLMTGFPSLNGQHGGRAVAAAEAGTKRGRRIRPLPRAGLALKLLHRLDDIVHAVDIAFR